MANTCITSWTIIGPAKRLDEFVSSVNSVLDADKTKKACLNDILKHLGLPEKGYRSQVFSFDFDKTAETVSVSTEDATVPDVEAMDSILTRFPGLKALYCAENFEDDVFMTNDRERLHYKARYAFDFEVPFDIDADPVEYFDTEEDLLAFVKKNFGFSYESADDVSVSLEEDIEDACGEMAFISLHEIEYV